MELDTVGLGITPTAEMYTVAIDTLLDTLARPQAHRGGGRGDPGVPS